MSFVWMADYELPHLVRPWEITDGTFQARCCDCGWTGPQYGSDDPKHNERQAELDAKEHARDAPPIPW